MVQCRLVSMLYYFLQFYIEIMNNIRRELRIIIHLEGLGSKLGGVSSRGKG